ncbi:hypothetical protein FSP39_014768 [Pinctada imbricata]|uniref:Uncharacterized protein n=1 Tax=Pinctada imbricata TaxID=66713 RepID=A0AA88XNP8_PINIB|nr:hypothetical protein FSP39_014768 [Pinctada imbricata]
MLFTVWRGNHDRSLLGLLCIISQICYIYGLTVGPITDTTQLFENNSVPDLNLNITEASVSPKSIKDNGTNTTSTHENGRRTLTSSISVNIKSLFKRKEFRKEKVNLILLPGLALVCFITMVCFRICKWKREDTKFKTRGCSYDVTNFVILAEGDAGYHNVEIASNYDTVNSYASVFNKVPYMTYDTITSYKSLQYRIDTQIFSNVASYSSYLRNPAKKNGPSSSEFKDKSSKSKMKKKERNKEPKGEIMEKEPVARKIPGTRFSIVPALDNYMRLKREGVRSISSSSPNSPSDVTDLSTPGTPSSPRRLVRHKVSFTEKSKMRESGNPTKSILLSNKCDRETQVYLPKRTTSRTSSGSVNKSIPECDSCDRNSIEMKDLSSKSGIRNSRDSIHQEALTDLEISGKQYDSSCKIIVEADVHNTKSVDKVILNNNNNLDGSTMYKTISHEPEGKTLHTDGTCEVYDLSYDDDEIVNAEGFTRARLSAPTVNGLIPYLQKRRNSEQTNNERTDDTRSVCRHVRRPRSLSPLLNIKISPKDVQDTNNCKCNKHPRKFSLGTLHGPHLNSESSLNGHKSFSSIRELLKLPAKSDASCAVLTNGYCESSESMSLLSCEDDEIDALNEQVSAVV